MKDSKMEEEFTEWWVSCPIFTVWVKTTGTKILATAPIAKKWIGQNFFRFVAYYNADINRLDETPSR
jgi:hypothetical protein